MKKITSLTIALLAVYSTTSAATRPVPPDYVENQIIVARRQVTLVPDADPVQEGAEGALAVIRTALGPELEVVGAIGQETGRDGILRVIDKLAHPLERQRIKHLKLALTVHQGRGQGRGGGHISQGSLGNLGQTYQGS